MNVDADERSSILLTFTGGGHSVEFSFTSDEGLDDRSYGIEMGISGGFELGNWVGGFAIDPGPKYKLEGEHKSALHAPSVTNARSRGTKTDVSCPSTFSATHSLVISLCECRRRSSLGTRSSRRWAVEVSAGRIRDGVP